MTWMTPVGGGAAGCVDEGAAACMTSKQGKADYEEEDGRGCCEVGIVS